MVKIMYGLPASGKTSFALDLYEKARYEDTRYVNLDKQDAKEFQNFPTYGVSNDFVDIIIDGFFKNTEDLILRLNRYLKRTYRYHYEFTVYEFEQDIQASLQNDVNRARDNLAVNSIVSGIEKFNESYFNSAMTNSLQSYQVIRFKLFVIPMKTFEPTVDNFRLYSAWRYGESIAEGFVELDTYLEDNYPTITFLQYKKLMKLAKLDEQSSSDYYDKQSTTSVQWSILYSEIESVTGESR